MIKKAYKYEIFPNQEQKRFIDQHFAVGRRCYNYCLNAIKDAYEKDGTRINASVAIKDFIRLKYQDGLEWMGEVDSRMPYFESTNLNRAYSNFFRKVKQNGIEKDEKGRIKHLPKFKSRNDNNFSYQTDSAITLIFPHHTFLKKKTDNNKNTLIWSNTRKMGGVKLPKFDKEIKFKADRVPPLTANTKTVTISKNPSGKYFISVLIEFKNSNCPELRQTGKVIGIDFGIKHFLTTSEGVFIDMPEFKDNKRLAILQKRHSNKKRISVIDEITGKTKRFNSKNRIKAQQKVAKFHYKVAKRKEYFFYQVATELLNRKDVKAYILEDLSIKNMSKRAKPKLSEDGTHYEKNNASAKSGLNKKIVEASFFTFYTILSNLAKEKGIEIIKVNPMYTSQRCNSCGHIDSKNRVNQSKFSCKECGHQDNADVNAGKNIRDLHLGLWKTPKPKKSSKAKILKVKKEPKQLELIN